MQERWLSVEQIVKHLVINPDIVRKWIERKTIPGPESHPADLLARPLPANAGNSGNLDFLWQ